MAWSSLVTHPDAPSPLPFTTARPTHWGHRSQCVRPPYVRAWPSSTDDTTPKTLRTFARHATSTPTESPRQY
jgi:hypothetical protein